MERKERHEQTETSHEKKIWITPEIFDSPVIAITEGAPGPGFDGGAYS